MARPIKLTTSDDACYLFLFLCLSLNPRIRKYAPARGYCLLSQSVIAHESIKRMLRAARLHFAPCVNAALMVDTQAG